MTRPSRRRATRPALLITSALLLAGCASGGTPERPVSGGEPPGGEAATAPATAPASAPDTAQAAASSPAPPAEAQPVAPIGGIFTDDQARRGRTTFDEVCSECHTTAEFRGRSFQSNWGRRTVYSFFRTIRSTMPDDNPGGLEEQVYLDVVAYILNLNGHDGGAAELSADSPMRKVRIAPPEEN